MSDIDSILLSAQGGQLVANLAQRFGLSEEQIERSIEALAPALAIGLDHAAEEPQVFVKAVGALSTATRYSFFDEADAAHGDDSVAFGKDLLNDLFGSPAETGQILQAAARDAGVRADILGQLLPILLSVLMSGLTKSINDKGLGGILGQLANSGALGQILEQVLAGAAAPQRGPAQGDPTGGPTGGGGLSGGPLSGGLGGLLGGILGSLLGGARRAPQQGDGLDRGGPGKFERGGSLDDVGSGSIASGPAGLPPGIDQASAQEAIDEIKKSLRIGRSGGSAAGQGASNLESILGQILAKR